MRYSELSESPAQVKTLSAISQAIVGFIYTSIQHYRAKHKEQMALLSDKDADWFDPEFGKRMNASEPTFAPDHNSKEELKNFRASNFKSYSPEIIDAYYKELVTDLGAAFKGNYRSEPADYPGDSIHFELGTVGEVLKRANANTSSMDKQVLEAVSNVLIILTDSKHQLGFSAHNEDPNHPGDVEISFAKLIGASKMALRRLASILAHELTHSMDSRLTNGKNGTNKNMKVQDVGSEGGYAKYLASQIEVNARYTQLAATLDHMIQNNEALKTNEVQRKALIIRLIKKNKLTAAEIGEDKYKRILKRLAVHLNHE